MCVGAVREFLEGSSFYCSLALARADSPEKGNENENGKEIA